MVECPSATLPGSLKKHFPFTNRFFDLPDGHKLHFIDEGPNDPNKPVLLMVHGNPTWSFYWRKLIQYYCQKFRVIAIDHMGSGLSDKPADYAYDLSTHIQNLSCFIESHHLKNISLFVHDWGGPIGLGYAIANPTHIHSLVIFNTAAFPNAHLPLRIAICKMPVIGKFLIQRLNLFAASATFMATTKKMPVDIRQGYLYPYRTYADRLGIFRFVKDIPMKDSHPSWSCLSHIASHLVVLQKHPILLCWGAKDFVFNLRFLDQWQKRFPQARTYVFSQAGHYVVEEAEEQICSAVDSFFCAQKCHE